MGLLRQTAAPSTTLLLGPAARTMSVPQSTAPQAPRARRWRMRRALLPAGASGTIRAELGKESAGRFAVGIEAWFALPKHAVMPLCEVCAPERIAPAPRG